MQCVDIDPSGLAQGLEHASMIHEDVDERLAIDGDCLAGAACAIVSLMQVFELVHGGVELEMGRPLMARSSVRPARAWFPHLGCSRARRRWQRIGQRRHATAYRRGHARGPGRAHGRRRPAGLAVSGARRCRTRRRLSTTGRPAAMHWALIASQPWPESIAPWGKGG